MRLLLALALLAGTAWPQTCTITSDTTPPSVPAGGTHTFTATAGCTFTVTGGGFITSGGVYTAPAHVWAQDVTRGWQMLPNSSVYKLPINGLSVDPRSGYWLQRAADGYNTNSWTYHTFKGGTPGIVNFYDNAVTNSTPTQSLHFLNGGPWQDTPFPIPLPPNVYSQDGWSQDRSDGDDDHHLAQNVTTGDDTEIYAYYPDFQTYVITAGNPTTIAYTTQTIRTLQTPLRIWISGITGGCSILNGTYLAPVLSQTPGTGGTLSVAVNTTGLNCSAGAPKVSGGSVGCTTCDSAGGVHYYPNSNALTAGTDAAGSPLSAQSVHMEEWWNVVQKNILDPACGCVTLGHALRTTLYNGYISPRNLWPAVTGNGVTGGHPNMVLLSATTGTTTTFTISSTSCSGQSFLQCQLPCPGFTYTVGCTFNIVIGNQNPYSSTWAAANGNWLATAVSNTSFSIPLNSTGFPTLPANGTFIFDWMPYGTRIRLKTSFNNASVCTSVVLTDKCPYEQAILNTLKVYGMLLMDGTIPGSNWQTGMVMSEFQPDQLTLAMHDLNTNQNFGGTPTSGGIEQYLEVVDESGQQINTSPPYTDKTNQLGLTANNRVTVTASCGGCTPASIDVQLLGTAVGTDRERITMVQGTTYQLNTWVSGNPNTAVTYAMSPPVTGASVSPSGLVAAPATLSAEARTTIIATSTADPTANVYIDTYFIPVGVSGNIFLAFGQQDLSYTDIVGNKWWGQYVTRPFNSTYENLATGFSYLNGTWDAHSAAWISGGTVDPQLYGMSTSSQNDTNLSIVIPNGNYTVTLYGEPGYGITGSGQNIYDVEIQGNVVSSYNDGWLLSGSQLYHGYTVPFPVTVSNGLLQFNGRIRKHDPGGHGMSLSSLLISTGGSCLLAVTTTSPLPGGGIHVPYSDTLTAKCGDSPYAWTLVSGTLPNGLTLSTSGVISGVPTSAGTSIFTVQVSDSASHTATLMNASLTIVGPNPPTLSIGITGLIIPQGVIK